jgi:peptide/nickel transport system permease protein
VPYGRSQILLDAEPPAGALDVDPREGSAVSPDRLLWQRLRANRPAILAGRAIIVLLLIAILAPLIVAILGLPGPDVHNAGTVNSFGIPAGPSFSHPFGVDEMGRDVLVRVIYGARTALIVGIGGTAIATLIGTAIGLLAGLYGGWTRTVLMGIVDAFLAFPAVLLALGIGDACRTGGCVRGVIQPGVSTVTFAVALCSFPYLARFVYRRVVALREQQFVLAARSLGASSGEILQREILPNLLAPLAAYSLLLIPANILLEAAMAFLGVGIGSSTADWGQMISRAGSDILSGDSAWWYLVFPGLALLLAALAFNVAADGLLDALRGRGSGER